MIIYVLVDPRDGAIRYVGQTRDPSTRGCSHRNPAPKNQSATAKWARKIRALGMRITLLPVFKTDSQTALDQAERIWIRTFRALGFRLLNHEDGGNAGARLPPRGIAPWNKGKKMPATAIAAMSSAAKGRKQSPAHIEARKLGMLGHVVSAETRSRISAALVGKSPSAEARAKISATLTGRRGPRGHHFSDEHKAKLAAARVGRTLSAEHRKAIGAGLKGRAVSEETRERQRVSMTGFKFGPMSDDHRLKISAALKGRISGPRRKGYKLGPRTDEVKARISAVLKGRPMMGRPRNPPRFRINLLSP